MVNVDGQSKVSRTSLAQSGCVSLLKSDLVEVPPSLSDISPSNDLKEETTSLAPPFTRLTHLRVWSSGFAQEFPLLLLGCVLLGAAFLAWSQHEFLSARTPAWGFFLVEGGVSTIGGLLLAFGGDDVERVYVSKTDWEECLATKRENGSFRNDEDSNVTASPEIVSAPTSMTKIGRDQPASVTEDPSEWSEDEL